MKIILPHLMAAGLLLGWLHGDLRAQVSLQNEVLAATGLSGTVAGITVSATVGEAVTATIAGSQSLLTQGFHQTQLIIVPVRDVVAATPVLVFPNPVASACTVAFEKPVSEDVRYAVFDLQGRTLFQGILDRGVIRHQLDLSALAPGVFQLALSSPGAGHLPAVFQLIKIAP